MSPFLKRLLFISILVLLVLYLVGRRLEWWGGKETAAGKPGTPGAGAPAGPGAGGPGAGGPPPRAAVRVAVVRKQALDNKLTATGTLLANEEIEIHPEISGLVEKINFQEGQRVRKGDVLVAIRTDDLRAQLQKLKYSQQLAATNEERQRRLLEKEAVSRQEYDIAQTQLNTLKSDIAYAEAQLAKATLRAPFDGRIGLRYISSGSYVTPQTRIATVSATDPMKLDFSLPAKYAAQVKPGQQIKFQVEGGASTYTGTVYATDPVIDPATRTLTLRARCPNPKGELFPGMFANVNLVLSTQTDALLVPNEALEAVQGGYRVYKVTNGTAQPLPVATGLRTPSHVEVTQGLSAGDTVVASGIQVMKPGIQLVIKGIYDTPVQQ